MENSSSIARHQMEEVLSSSKSKAAAAALAAERKPRPKPEQKVDCPRCKSGNTKFCYYNNYSMSQPRYFCKACRRYWTHGGSLRNVPIGGGCRKTKRSSSSSDLHNKLAVPPAPEPMVPPAACMDFPNVHPTFISAGFELPSRDHHHHLSLATFMSSSSSSSSSSSNPAVAAPGGTSFLDVLRGGGGAGLLDGGHRPNNGYYGGNWMVMPLPTPPPPTTFGVAAGPMQHGGLAVGGIGGAAAAQGMLPNGTMMGAGEEGDGGGMKAMVGLQWQPQLDGAGGGGGSTTGAQQNNVMIDNSNNGGAGAGDDGSSRDCYWINNGGPNPWQSLINSSSLM